MFKKLAAAVSEYNMLDGKNHVIVALSGGADSMSLLHCLAENSEYFGIKVSAAHLNHLLRGEESERDLNFVADECRKMGIELFTKRVDISELSKERKIGLEECGREERYRFFSELAADEKTVVATAHTASDNAETILLNITRGSGMEGLCGIPPVRGNIIRPLIGCSRAEIEEYCAEHNIPYVTDSSNLSLDYSRNKIRLSILPTLQQINPSVETSINRLSEIISKNLTYIHEASASEYERCKIEGGMSIAELKACDRNLLPNVIRLAIAESFNISAEKKHIELIENIISSGHGAVELRKNMTVRAFAGSLLFEKASADSGVKADSFAEFALILGGKIFYNDKIYSFSPKTNFFNEKNNKINKKLLNQCLSCDIISCDTVVRNRKSGDIFRPIGRNCTKTVKKLFTELKVPLSERNNLLVIANGSVVYWIEGIGASQDALPKEIGSACFTVEIEEVKNEE